MHIQWNYLYYGLSHRNCEKIDNNKFRTSMRISTHEGHFIFTRMGEPNIFVSVYVLWKMAVWEIFFLLFLSMTCEFLMWLESDY